MKGQGHPVHFVKGWQTRGIGTLDVHGAVLHHTAGRNDLHLVVDGSWRNLHNALCNSYTSQRGHLYIVAAEQAWHAGRGWSPWAGRDGNGKGWGNEGEGLGTSRGPITPAHYQLQVTLGWALTKVFKFPVANLWDHFKWTPRKIDRYLPPHGTDTDYRRRVRNYKAEAPASDGGSDMLVKDTQRRSRAARAAQAIIRDWWEVAARDNSGRSTGTGRVNVAAKVFNEDKPYGIPQRYTEVDGYPGEQTMDHGNLAACIILKVRHRDRDVLESELVSLIGQDLERMRNVVHSFKAGQGGHVV